MAGSWSPKPEKERGWKGHSLDSRSATLPAASWSYQARQHHHHSRQRLGSKALGTALVIDISRSTSWAVIFSQFLSPYVTAKVQYLALIPLSPQLPEPPLPPCI